jgi:putative SOS response-associated peptidase YedK
MKMCGRLNQFAKIPSLSLAGRLLRIEQRKKQREDKKAAMKAVNNICPTEYADVVTLSGGELCCERMRFGLIPAWAKGNKAEAWRKFMLTFNARCETVFDLASYRGPILKQRCLIPVRGWHEWPASGRPFFIHRADEQPLLLAGIWDVWESLDPADEESGSVVTSMSVITTPPGRYMAKFHDRSPLVLEGEAASAWLDPGLDKARVQAFLRPSRDDQLEAYRVSTAVNSPRNKSEEVWQAVGLPVPQAGDTPVEIEDADSPQLKLF